MGKSVKKIVLLLLIISFYLCSSCLGQDNVFVNIDGKRGGLIFENERYAFIGDTEGLYKMNKQKLRCVDSNTDFNPQSGARNNNYLYIDAIPCGGMSASQSHRIYVFNMQKGILVGSTLDEYLDINMLGFDSNNNLIFESNGMNYKVNTNAVTEKLNMVDGKLTKVKKDFFAFNLFNSTLENEKFQFLKDYVDVHKLTSNAAINKVFLNEGDTFYIVYVKDKKSLKKTKIAIIPAKSQCPIFSLLSNGLVYSEEGAIPQYIVNFSNMKAVDKLNYKKSFKSKNYSIDVYQNGIYEGNKKIADGDLITGCSLSGSKFYYYNYDGEYVFYNQIDLKTKKMTIVKKYKAS